jgi:hypothetical protein
MRGEDGTIYLVDFGASATVQGVSASTMIGYE